MLSHYAGGGGLDFFSLAGCVGLDEGIPGQPRNNRGASHVRLCPIRIA
jgi:hypothetical protein